MKLPLFALSVLLLVSPASPAEGQRSPAIEAQPLPTYVTQLGKTHFPAGEASLSEMANAVVALRSGAVVVAGRTYGSLGETHAGSSNDPDAFVARLDPLGNLEWIRQIGAITGPTIPAINGDPAGPGGDSSGWDEATDLALAPDGSIYVAGYTASDLGETNDRGDTFLAKFDAQGSLQWLRQLGVETKAAFVQPGGSPLDTNNGSKGSSILVHPSGDVFVAGSTGHDLAELNGTGPADGFAGDVFLARFTADGRLRWVRQMGAVSSGSVGFDSIAAEYDPQIALHPSGAIVLAATSVLEFFVGSVYHVTRSCSLFTFDAQGTPLGSLSVPGTSTEGVRGLAIDPRSGRIFLTGWTEGNLAEPKGGVADAFVASFELDLDILWIRQIGKTTAANHALDVSGREHGCALGLDRNGHLILAGETYGSLVEHNTGAGQHSDVFIATLRAADGEVLGLSQIGYTAGVDNGLETYGKEAVQGMAFGPGGAIVVAGYTTGDFAEPNAGVPDVFGLGVLDVFVMRLTPDGKL